MMATDGSTIQEPLTCEEAKRILRRLELDAYSAVVTAFRAQGDLSKSKKAMLNDLCSHLSISTERHRAEVRRAVNDDRLNLVAGCMHGPGTSTEWASEGRRLISLMPRLVPQTVFTAKASAAANTAAENNQKLPLKTDIEIVPLPQKQKSQSSKSDRSMESRDKLYNRFPSSGENAYIPRIEDRVKKKKGNVLHTKPSSLSLSKTLNNPYRSSLSSQMRPLMKTSFSKCPTSSITGAKVVTTISTSSPSMKFSTKPVIVQRSPTKNSLSRTSLSNNVNIPMSSLNSSPFSKSESLQLNNQSSIKIYSNSPSSNSNPIILSTASLQNNILTQKIKFKTPLPKPKVKATKFKSMMPLQRSLLTSSISNELSLSNSTLSNIISSSTPIKSTNSTQNLNVKVVQVAKSGSNPTSIGVFNSIARPLVVVSNSSSKISSNSKSSFNNSSNILNLNNEKNKIIPSTSVSSSNQPTSSKSNITSKTLPLATGFKMIAVTTIVPGTTQVKTVYIATPIMSMTKTVSQSNTSTSCSSNQSVKILSSSLTSTLQSLVAKSLNTYNTDSSTKSTLISSFTKNHPDSKSILNLNKNSKVTLPKTIIASSIDSSGSNQNVMLNSKLKTPITLSSKIRNSLLANANQYLSKNNECSISVDPNSSPIKRNIENSIADSNNQLHEKTSSMNLRNTFFSNIPKEKLGLMTSNKNENTENSHSVVLNQNNLEEIDTTCTLLNDNLINAEETTASPTDENEDITILSAGEKFLEQLTAKFNSKSTVNVDISNNQSNDSSGNVIIELPNSSISKKINEIIVTDSKIINTNNIREKYVNTKESAVLKCTSKAEETFLKFLSSSSQNTLRKDTINLDSLLPSSGDVNSPSITRSTSAGSLNLIPSTIISPMVLSKNLPAVTTVTYAVESFGKAYNQVNNNILKPKTSSNSAVINTSFINSKLDLTNANLNVGPSSNLLKFQKSNNLKLAMNTSTSQELTPQTILLNRNTVAPISNNDISGKAETSIEFLNSKSPSNSLSQKLQILQAKQNSTRQQILNNHLKKDHFQNKLNDINLLSSQIISNSKLKPGSQINTSKIKITPQNKLQMSLPGAPSLNISPILVNNIIKKTAVTNANQSTLKNGEPNTQVLTTKINTITNSDLLSTSLIKNNLNANPLLNHNSSFILNKTDSTKDKEHNNIVTSIISSNNDKSRKRKFSSITTNDMLNFVAPRAQASWIRGAGSLLQRVSRYRGTNKQKGDMNAASWFTKPVDPNEAPGYYRIVKTPMDFGKVKKKLEDGEYFSYSNFYEDMMLIKKNCYLYNPVGHLARKDCEDVFNFFETEYKKLLERWEKHHVSPQKKLKLSEEVTSAR